jgi:hypothetical protein
MGQRGLGHGEWLIGDVEIWRFGEVVVLEILRFKDGVNR